MLWLRPKTGVINGTPGSTGSAFLSLMDRPKLRSEYGWSLKGMGQSIDTYLYVLCALQICAWEIFLHWFKCTNYSLYDIKHISKNTTGNTIYPLYLGLYLNTQRALEVHRKYYTMKSCIFDSQNICSVAGELSKK